MTSLFSTTNLKVRVTFFGLIILALALAGCAAPSNTSSGSPTDGCPRSNSCSGRDNCPGADCCPRSLPPRLLQPLHRLRPRRRPQGRPR